MDFLGLSRAINQDSQSGTTCFSSCLAIRIESLFSENEFIYDDYYVYSYEWYSHDGSHRTYQVDEPAFYTDVLCRVPISSTLIIILLEPNVVRWLN